MAFGHWAVVKKGLSITRILCIHCSLGCLSVAKEFWFQSNPLPVSRCVDCSFGGGYLVRWPVLVRYALVLAIRDFMQNSG